MRRVILDSNIYIDWINDRRHEDVLFQFDAVAYLSAIVVMELYAGAFTERDRRLIRKLVATFARPDRIVVPSERVYQEAGDVLRWLQEREGYDLASTRGLSNDVLIALSARAIGAVVITLNDRHFAAVNWVRPFKLNILRLEPARRST